MPEIIVINGPNLSRLGSRNPDIYGTDTLASIEARLTQQATKAGFSCACFCGNGEGEIVDFIDQNFSAAGLIINPGALMMNGWSLRDTLQDFLAPSIEIHISNISARESFRHNSILSSQVTGVIAGLGTVAYDIAILELIRRLSSGEPLK